MVGGVIAAVVKQPKCQTLMVRGTGCESKDRLFVDTAYTGKIDVGEQAWWQASHLFVGEKDIGRVGYAYRLEG